MSKNPTKAADNVFCIARKRAAQIDERLNGRDGAAEVLCIDRSRLARIELGALVPYPEEAMLMAGAYHAPELVNYYCTSCCPIGCCTQQRLDVSELDRVTVKLTSAFRKGDSIRDMLLDITEDGVIEDNERPELDRVINYLDGVTKAAAELKLWAEKNLGRTSDYDKA